MTATYVANELRALVDEPATAATTIRLLELAVMVERMERQLDSLADEEREDTQSLAGLIARVNR